MPPAVNDLPAFVQGILDQQPFSDLIGTQLAHVSPGEVELHLPIRATLLQQHRIAHGGVVAALADTALAFAGGTVLGDMVTAEFKINYLEPTTGTLLIAHAHVVHHSERQAVCQCHLWSEGQEAQRTLCALAQGTIRRARPSSPPTPA